MNKINQKADLLRKREIVKIILTTQKNLEVNPKTYVKPEVTKVHVLEPSKRVFMGCWQQSYSANDGDGC